MKPERLIAVLGSSLPREGSSAYEIARNLGGEIARRGGTVLCGGYGGVMEAACRGAREEGGAAVGVLLAGGGEGNRFLTRRIVADDLADRLRRLRDLPDAWIFLEHGLGTMLELLFVAESIVKRQTPLRPIVLLGDFWGTTLDRAIDEASAEEGRTALRSSVRAAATASEAAAAVLPG